MIEVRTMKLSTLRDKEKVLYYEADRQRRERASRFIQADDRLRCLAAGILMKRCLPGYSEALLYTGVDGKPFLRGGVPFSLSHGGEYIVLAWCNGVDGIGIDVEPIREMEYYQAIIPCFMTSGEIKAVGESAREAVRVWTRKESLYKCVGEGVTDFRELPEVLEDRVLFGNAMCCLNSWEKDGHMFSVALRNTKRSMEFNVEPVESP
ncbi:MAG: 4'-phosphopantetheinyl transferase superfamily protein [Clostridia bacterium]|nr:4'-phosphopantetheinyl transferase superfamily protein [Clostridia bacterium]